MRYTGSDLSKVLRVCGFSSLGFCVCYLIGIWQPYLIVAVLFVTLGHLGGGAQWTLSSYGVQMRSPDAMRGRIIAGDFAMMTLVMSVTTTVVGVLSDAFGVRPAMTVFAAAAAVASVVYLNSTRSLRARLSAESSTRLS
jgi:MFS family permease